MRAAVVIEFGTPPTCRDFPDPRPRTEDEVVVDVLAAGLHPRVRSQAGGTHYTGKGELPLVPGIDGVGRAPDGTLRYFVLPDTSLGSMAERTVIDTRRSVVLPADADPVTVAAGMNPAMSAWIALRRRIEFAAGQDVLVLGATGNAGRLAVQVAKHLGAGRVIAAGRDPEKLAEVEADDTRTFDELGKAADVDVVLDYVWGPPTTEALRTIVTERA
ncbi:quinone oxidoreductase, partial [Amycolatopsis pretoriensis]